MKPSGLWQTILADEFDKEYYKNLTEFVLEEYKTQNIHPPKEEIFHALDLVDYDRVKVLLLGQDPYHGENQAHGLSFSVKPGIKIPPSLRNIYKELKSDLDIDPPNHGFLEAWASQGILMLNTVLTVRNGEANSHKKKGWEIFTDEIIHKLNLREEPIIFVLWGNPAKKKTTLITSEQHFIIESAHPSPLSARRGFIDSKPFSKINEILVALNQEPIDWQLEDIFHL